MMIGRSCLEAQPWLPRAEATSAGGLSKPRPAMVGTSMAFSSTYVEAPLPKVQASANRYAVAQDRCPGAKLTLENGHRSSGMRFLPSSTSFRFPLALFR